MSSWFNSSASRPLGAVGRQQQLPLTPRGAPDPRPASPALPRPQAPGFKPSRPAPLVPETEDGR